MDRKVKVVEHEIVERSDQRKCASTKVGGSQKNNLIKWIKSALKFAVKKKLIKANFALFVEKEQIRSGGFKMWTDELWDRMVAHFPHGTKQRLTFDLAGYTAQRRGDIYLLGWDQFIPPEGGLPHGSLRVAQDKG